MFWCDAYNWGSIARRQASIAIDKLARAYRDRVIPELKVGTRDMRVGVNRWDQDRQDCESGNRLISRLLANKQRSAVCAKHASVAATRCL